MHKVAFQLGSFTVHWFGVLVALGFAAGFWTAGRRGARDGFPAEKIADAGVWLIVGGVLGARGLYVMSYWREQFAGAPWTDIFMIQNGGLVFYGGLIGGTLAGLLFLWKQKLPTWKFGDAIAPSLALGYLFGRFGCLMNGCCYGHACSLPWAIHFPSDHETKGIGVHPTQIYDSLLNLALYAGLAWLHRRKKFDGQVFASYLIGFAFTRSFVEMFRGDYPVRYLGGAATPAHLVSIGILLAGIILYCTLARRPATANSLPRPR